MGGFCIGTSQGRSNPFGMASYIRGPRIFGALCTWGIEK